MTDVHVSTATQPGDYDALETAKPDEPIFVVQGGDPLGPPTVQFWADEARKTARGILNGSRANGEASDDYTPTPTDLSDAERLLRKATSAEQVSWAMQGYQRGGDEEAPPAERSTYSGLTIRLTEEAEEAAGQRKTLISCAGQLHNALAMANDVADALAKLRLHPEWEIRIRDAVNGLKGAASAIEPRRGNERS